MLDSYTSTFPQPRFWQALARARFELPRCATCDEWQAPGATKCARCGSGRLEWHDASGAGTVYSLLERMAPPGQAPTIIAVLTLDEGPTVMAAIAGTPPRADVGMRVQALLGPGQGYDGLPVFAESAT